MRDMNGNELCVGDRIVYEYHGDGDNGLQLATVEKVRDGNVTVIRTTPHGNYYNGPTVTLKRSHAILRLS